MCKKCTEITWSSKLRKFSITWNKCASASIRERGKGQTYTHITYTQVICCQVSICLVKLLRSRWSTKIDGEHKINMSSCTFTFGLSVNNASQHWLNPWQLVFNRHMQAICARWIVPNGKAASFQQKNQWWETINKYESPPLSLCLLSAENIMRSIELFVLFANSTIPFVMWKRSFWMLWSLINAQKAALCRETLLSLLA